MSVATHLCSSATLSRSPRSLRSFRLRSANLCALRLTLCLPAQNVVAILNIVFSTFDNLTTKHNVYKVTKSLWAFNSRFPSSTEIFTNTLCRVSLPG